MLPPFLVTIQARLLFLHLVQVFEYFVQSSLTTEVYFTVPEFDLGLKLKASGTLAFKVSAYCP